MQSFRQLTDAAKINKKPQRIRIKTVAANGTLEQALRSFNVPENKLEEHSIINGMQRTGAVTKGMLIKVVGI
jgi:predicted Zn-dependent protease